VERLITVLSIIGFTITQQIHAQSLLLMNQELNKVIQVVPGNLLAVSYKGYNGLTEFVKLTVTDISDSTITLGVDPNRVRLLQHKHDGPMLNTYKVIKISDIVAFRRMTFGRRLLKTSLSVATYVGTFVLMVELVKNPSISPAEAYFISLGAGIGSMLLLDAALPETTRYRMSEGWQWRVVN
jgi:hypothetical protein